MGCAVSGAARASPVQETGRRGRSAPARPSPVRIRGRDAGPHAVGRAGAASRWQMPTQIKEDCPLRAPERVVCTSYAPGFEQVRSVVAAIAGDVEAADRVALVLPQTGVCTVSDDIALTGGGACCAPAAQIVAAPSVAAICCDAPTKNDAALDALAAQCCDPVQARKIASASGGCEPAIAGQADKGCC